MRVEKHQSEEISEINVTPFIDVMLVLLVVFMVVTPIVTSSVKVELPQAVSEQPQDTAKPLIITIKQDHKVFVGEQLATDENLAALLFEKTGANKEGVVFFEVDKSVPYEVLIAAVERVKQAGYSKIAFSSKVGR